MKLAIISPGFVPVPAVRGGAVEQLITYIIEANEVNHKYDIELYTVDDPQLIKKTYKYTKLIKVSKSKKDIFSRIYFGIKNRFMYKFHLPWNTNFFDFKIVKEYKTNYYDAVLVENNMNIYSMLLKKVNREKVYFHLHNDVGSDDLAKTNKKAKKVIATADKILVVSDFLKKKLINLGAKSSKVKVVYNGLLSRNFPQVSQSEKEKIRKKYGLSNSKVVFTFVGRLCADKGVDKLLSALRLLKEKDNIKCIIVGRNFFGSKGEDKYIQNLQVISKSIQDKLIFTGYINNNELYKIYSISDCVVIPSQFEEVFGVVALEAMTMKKAVIASRSGGLPEVLSNSCAIFINRDDNFISNLAKAMDYLAEHPSIRKSMAIEGKKRSNLFSQNEQSYFEQINKALFEN